MKSLLILVLCLFSFNTNSAELTSQSYIDGFKTGWTYFYQGAYMQFTEKNNLYYAGAAVPSLWYSFHEDKRISANAQTKPIRGYQRIASDISPFMSFPIIPIAFYTYGVKKDNTKAVQFATETFATLYLALIESAVLSAIPIHERPNNNGLSAWETRFREKSSFPSGHVVPYAAFALKAFQFYGPVAAIVPSFLFVGASIQRVRDGKHYLSDVVGGFFVTAFASEGVRKAGGWTDNHPVYKAIFERNMQVGYIEYNGAIGPKITFDW